MNIDRALETAAKKIRRELEELFDIHKAECKEKEQCIREIGAWILQAYKEGYQDAHPNESKGFDDDWESSMAKMVFDEKLEPPR